jgi:hypothetical protein
MRASERDALPTINVKPADLQIDGGGTPFGGAQRVRYYRPRDLRFTEKGARTERTKFFENKLVELSKRLGGPVPYAFRILDGTHRSLDAGCLGFLYHATPPEVEFELDKKGMIAAVRPIGALVRRVEGRTAEPAEDGSHAYTLEELSRDGARPAMELLVAAAAQGDLVSYGRLAEHLEIALGKASINPRHVGHVAGHLMDLLQEIEPDAPLINLLVVRGDNDQPGKGATPYIRGRFAVKGRLSKPQRRRLIVTALNEVRVFARWSELYQRLFGSPLSVDERGKPSDFDHDGQGDNPWFGGQAESPEHKALKQYVLTHPSALRMRLKDPVGKPERRLLSGDAMDVEFIEGPRRVGVEVKSIRSGRDDLRRGIYQCVKYHAVMVAESGFKASQANCDAVLVTERQLPNDLKALAARLGVRHRVIPVNGTQAHKKKKSEAANG